MKILLINKFLYPKGGSEAYVFRLGRMLEERGHTVQYFGLENRKNIVGNRAGAYVSHLDFSEGVLRNLKAPLRIIYSREARRKLRRVLEDFEPDVVHLNNIQFHLTPSVILETHCYRTETGRDVKIVCTAHDFQLVCPSHGLFDPQLRPCEKCLGGSYINCLRGRCVKNSYLKSLLATVDAYFWKHSSAYSYIDRIICPSRFLKDKLDIQARFSHKTLVLRNFMERDPAEETEKGDYVLQFGHLSREKGTYTLLEAARRMPDVRFLFAGYGEAAADVATFPNAEYVGFQSGKALRDLIQKSLVTVCPSICCENCPYSVMESLAYGTPVVGSRMGGIPELIRVGETGLLFEAGDAADLAAKLQRLLYEPGLLENMTENCKGLSFEDPDTYYEKLMRIYGATHEDL